MDQLMDIYVNKQGPSSSLGKRKSLSKSSESIYENVFIHTLEQNRTGPALSGAEEVKKSSCRAAAVCLGLLCLLLLTGLVTLVCIFTKSNSEWKMEMFLLHNSYTNLTKQLDQLQSSYTNLIKERDRLQNNYTNLIKERDRLQSSYNNLIKERDRLQNNYTNLIKERDRLQSSYNNLIKERDHLHGVEDLTKKLNDFHRRLKDQYGWVYFSGSFYHISSLEKSWQESREDCLQRGADLVIINSKEEQDYITSLRQHVWIGLTDRDTEGTWKWVDGTQLTKSYWAPNEPNGHQIRDEDCAEIINHHSENNWNDDICHNKKLWICEENSQHNAQ
ncbi:CD209 antigen-like [Cottoperca gobio]|uniref:CD209 antigen-like n=1 Tax=Cottoperca gobio TaxID=56716 RepID=A0A6J2Q5P3_COTGO|nr:CD209 antigen-like [Cottoperca gobio]